MSELVASTLSRDEARSLTDEVRADAERLWSKLLELYEGGAHAALGYSSWGVYCETEFGMKQSRAYQLLEAGRVLDVVAGDSTMVERPKHERQARELAPLLDEPEQLREAWTEAVEEHGAAPTAADVREVVSRKTEKPASTVARPSLREAAREVIRLARKDGKDHYRVPTHAVNALISAAGKDVV